MSNEIFRPQSEVEKRDFINVNKKDYKTIFLERLNKAEQAHNKEKTYTPFDRNTARFVFEDTSNKMKEDIYRSGGALVSQELIQYALKFDFTPFKEAKRWELIGEKEAMDSMVINGRRCKEVVGMWIEFRNKEYPMNHTSMFMPLKIYNERKESKKK